MGPSGLSVRPPGEIKGGKFGAWAVACLWGSRQAACQRHRLIPCATEAEARALAERIVRRKTRRGYREAEG